MRRSWVGLGSCALLVAGCGGQVVGGSGEGDDAPIASSSPTASPSASAGKSASQSGTIEGDTALGDCELGPRAIGSQPCAWLAGDRCYQDRAMACNCICPRTHDSQCSSSFGGGQESRVKVTCD
jgi:hypothetical protein